MYWEPTHIDDDWQDSLILLDSDSNGIPVGRSTEPHQLLSNLPDELRKTSRETQPARLNYGFDHLLQSAELRCKEAHTRLRDTVREFSDNLDRISDLSLCAFECISEIRTAMVGIDTQTLEAVEKYMAHGCTFTQLNDLLQSGAANSAYLPVVLTSEPSLRELLEQVQFWRQVATSAQLPLLMSSVNKGMDTTQDRSQQLQTYRIISHLRFHAFRLGEDLQQMVILLINHYFGSPTSAFEHTDLATSLGMFATVLAELITKVSPHLTNPVNSGQIFRAFLEQEDRHKLSAGQLCSKHYPNYRNSMAEWICKFSCQLRYSTETFQLALSLFDRLLCDMETSLHSGQSVNADVSSQDHSAKNDLYLAAIGCMVLSAKLEERYPPDVGDMIYFARIDIKPEDLFKEEVRLLLHFAGRIDSPTPITMVRQILAEQYQPTDKQLYLASFFLDATMLTEPYGSYTPSSLAASAVYLSRLCCHLPTPNPPTAHTVSLARRIFLNANKHARSSVSKSVLHCKYSSQRYGAIIPYFVSVQ